MQLGSRGDSSSLNVVNILNDLNQVINVAVRVHTNRVATNDNSNDDNKFWCALLFSSHTMEMPTSGGVVCYLRFCQHKRGGHFETFGPGQVLVEFELVLQLQQLLTGEGRARPSALSQQTRLGAC